MEKSDITENEAMFQYLIRLGDNALILGQRLGEWCGNAHQLESDIALTNVALDQIGQARMLLSRAGELEAKGRDEDDLAFHRNEFEFRNNLLVEMDNGDFAQTIVRQYFFDVYQYHLLSALKDSEDEFLQAYAAKSLKEVAYHRELSKDWMLRLGGGTELSHTKMQAATTLLWPYTGELFEMSEIDEVLIPKNLVPDLKHLEQVWQKEMRATLEEAALEIPDTKGYMASGGRHGRHTEYLGYILAEMQYLPRTMPEASW